MTRIRLIAANTLREIVRQRLFLNIVVFGVGMVLFAMVVSNMTFGYPDRVVRSIGLSGVAIAANLMALLVGVSLVHREIEQRTLFVILTRPVKRWEYVVGRYTGMVVALAGVVLGFSLVFFAMLLYVSGSPSLGDVAALFGGWLEACVLGAFAVVLSTFSTPTLSTGIGLGFWIACSSTDDLVRLTEQATPAVKALSVGIATVLPSFARFNLRDEAIYGEVTLTQLAGAAGYGALLVIGLIAMASAVLSRRQMT